MTAALSRAVAEFVARRAQPGSPVGDSAALDLPPRLPGQGVDAFEALGMALDLGVTQAVRLDHPGYLAHMDPPTPWPTWVTAMMTASVNQNLLHPDAAPVARELERMVVDWLAPVFGVPFSKRRSIVPIIRYSGGMPSKAVSDADLVERLFAVFRTEGYEGASLSRLQQATGLQRSSLYHRFPAGKEDMAAAVLQEASRRFADDILAPDAVNTSPADRLGAIADRLSKFYEGGQLSCLLDTLSIGRRTPRLVNLTREAMAGWVESFRDLAVDAGADEGEATERAADAVAAIEGALVVARAMGDTGPFHRAVQSLPQRLLR